MRIRRLAVIATASALAIGACSSDPPSAPPPTAVTAPDSTTVPVTTSPTSSTPPSTTDSTTSTTSTPPDPTSVSLGLRTIAIADRPIAMVPRRGDRRLYVAERSGRVVRFDPGGDGTVSPPLLDIEAEVSSGGEQGLLGLAFSPDGSRLYLSWTDRDGASRITEWTMEDDRPEVDSRREVFRLMQPFPNHNGGHITFGSDGLLYLGLGDGGAGGDPLDAGQDTTTVLGSIIRIDVSVDEPAAHGRYGIPADNPFASEVFVIGVRNPWRFSFDRSTGDLWVGDVGQDRWEEIDFVPAGEVAGANLGWNRREGRHDFAGDAPADVIDPVAEYGHDRGVAVTGGFVYRGKAIPGLVGTYLFGDWRTARLWALPDGDRAEIIELGVGLDSSGLVSFAEDRAGELYVIDEGGPIMALEPA